MKRTEDPRRAQHPFSVAATETAKRAKNNEAYVSACMRISSVVEDAVPENLNPEEEVLFLKKLGGWSKVIDLAIEAEIASNQELQRNIGSKLVPCTLAQFLRQDLHFRALCRFEAQLRVSQRHLPTTSTFQDEFHV